jgi:hypothetical protein
MKSRRLKKTRKNKKGGMLRQSIKTGIKIVSQGIAKNQLQKDFNKLVSPNKKSPGKENVKPVANKKSLFDNF